jgi:hypothetical protein
MGEIVDLESYRRRRRRRALNTESSENRRQGERRQPRGDRSLPAAGPREAGGPDPNQAAKAGRDDPSGE